MMFLRLDATSGLKLIMGAIRYRENVNCDVICHYNREIN
jgi:hypothetical protein